MEHIWDAIPVHVTVIVGVSCIRQKSRALAGNWCAVAHRRRRKDVLHSRELAQRTLQERWLLGSQLAPARCIPPLTQERHTLSVWVQRRRTSQALGNALIRRTALLLRTEKQ